MRSDPLTHELLNVIGAIYVVMGIAAVSVDFFSSTVAVQPGGPLAIVVGIVVLIACRLGHLHLAANTCCWGILWGAIVHSALAGGLSSGSWIVNPISIALGGWLMGSRTALRMAAVSGVAAIGIYAMHLNGYVFLAAPPLLTLTTANVLFGLAAAVLSSASAGTFHRQLVELRTLSSELKAANAELEVRVARRTSELSSTVEKLKQTQSELIESEKLVSLASMVAGISHELNTPIGIAMTVTTTLHQKALDVKNALVSGPIQKSYLVSNLDEMAGMAELIERSVERAGALVTSFKKVAADQVSERRDVFDLRSLVDDLCNTMRPSVKNDRYVFLNEVPMGIQCDSLPGPVGQIILNLLQNAVFHGFDGRDSGTVRINAEVNGPNLKLRVSDDGVGMDSATLARVFEPFFTTKLGQGGSGLGLSVSHRIAVFILGGELSVSSAPNTGAQFALDMPLVTAGKI